MSLHNYVTQVFFVFLVVEIECIIRRNKFKKPRQGQTPSTSQRTLQSRNWHVNDRLWAVSFKKAEPRLRHVSAECPRQRVSGTSKQFCQTTIAYCLCLVCQSGRVYASNRHFLFLLVIQKTEPWENEKCEADMEKYVWEGSQSQRTLEQLLKRMPDREKAQDLPEVIEQYSRNVTHFHNEGSCLFSFSIH